MNADTAEKVKKYHIKREQNLRKLIKDHAYTKLLEYGDRFTIYQNDKNYYFHDKYWPKGDCLDKTKVKFDNDIPKNLLLFITGFLPSIITVDELPIKEYPSYKEDGMFWQYPCITEKDFYLRHINKKNALKHKKVHVYTPIPWATFIDKKSFNKAYIGAIASRVNSAKKVINSFGYDLHVHTFCQHIYWKTAKSYLQEIGITDLWLSHKNIKENEFNNIRLHPWGLYAVNFQDKNRSEGLIRKEIEDKRYFASFVGAHMDHYLSDVRIILFNLFKDNPDYKMVLNHNWHYHDQVYESQVKGVAKDLTPQKFQEILSYNRILSDSIFSLCPEGAGLNTLRLWESLAVGSIPVIIANDIHLPRLNLLHDAAVLINYDDIKILDQTLKSLTIEEVRNKQKKCYQFYEKYLTDTIFNSI
jgi:hypothetical protein